MAKGNGRRAQAGGGKSVHYLSAGGNKPAKRQTSKAVRQADQREIRRTTRERP